MPVTRIAAVLLILATSHCIAATRSDLEHDLAKTLWRSYGLYGAGHNGSSPTNWAQLRTLISDDYLARKEAEFAHLGRESGMKLPEANFEEVRAAREAVEAERR